ncbi:MAG: lipoprotein signal peptidase [Chitinophagaceae bacterium]|nr:lipoprotein signal peptidase [Chitinophagaceae bacterium]
MKYRHALLIILLIIIADQWSKIYIKTHFFYGEEVLVMGQWFRLHFIENNGMAFGMKFSQGDLGKLLLTTFRLIAVGFGFVVLKQLVTKKYSTGAIVCGALILAGAMGNLIDSMFYGLIFSESSFHVAKHVPFGTGYGKFLHGQVVDMLYFPMVEFTMPEWVPFLGGKLFSFFDPVFNIADMAISTGVITLLVFQKKMVHARADELKAANTEQEIIKDRTE